MNLGFYENPLLFYHYICYHLFINIEEELKFFLNLNKNQLSERWLNDWIVSKSYLKEENRYNTK